MIKIKNLKHGMSVSCKIENVQVDDAKISICNDKIYICQNKVEGCECEEKLGYKYSWFMSNTNLSQKMFKDCANDNYVENLKLKEMNYIVIDGNKIELSEETVENIKNTLNPYVPFVKDTNKFETTFLKNEMWSSIQIGKDCVPLHLKGKCLILSDDYNWKIIPNTAHTSFSKLLVATRK